MEKNPDYAETENPDPEKGDAKDAHQLVGKQHQHHCEQSLESHKIKKTFS